MRDGPGKDGVVLHTQKVAGISGSEAHLLQLLPDLRERGWDIRFLMLHEDEPGAWEFADALRARGVPLDDIRLRADVDPLAFGEVTTYLARVRPRILHTHLVHADVYGQLAGSVARVPLRLSTKHGFNEFREGRWFAFADRSVGSLAHVHIAISQGLAQYLAETEGFDEEAFEIVHYGISSLGDAPRTTATCLGCSASGGSSRSRATSSSCARSRRRVRACPGSCSTSRAAGRSSPRSGRMPVSWASRRP